MISVLLGVCQLDDRPLDAERLEAIRHQAVLPRGGWRSQVWTGARAGLAVTHPGASRPAVLEAPPWAFQCRLIWNGTLLNRRELETELRPEVELPRAPSDAELALAAYAAWGPHFPEHLLGEFALILWDEPRQRLLAARDALGLRDLLYRHEGAMLEVASQTALLHPPGGPGLDELDLEYLADFLATHTTAGPRTPFSRLRRLPSAHILVAEEGRVRLEPYWEIGGARSIHYAREEEYAEQMRHLFLEAVERCLDQDGRVWTELSGGLDSSSIAVAAHHVLAGKPHLDHGFELLTRVWNEAPDVDEREWSASVAEALGRPWHQIPCDGMVFDRAFEGARFRDEPGFGILLHPMYVAVAEVLEKNGVGTLLSGSRAEAVVLTESPPPLHLADLLRSFELRRLKDELGAWQKTLHEPFANLLLRNALAPLINPRRTLHFVDQDFKAHGWLSRDFVRRYHLRNRTRLGRMPLKFRLPTAQYHYELLGSSEAMVTRGYVPLITEVLHPFLYRPLVEYSFAIPWEEKVRPGVHKWLLRRAMVGLLPEKVRRRGNKYGTGPVIYRGFPEHWSELQPLIRDPILAELGVFDRDGFRRAAELARLGSAKKFAIFLGALALEVWVRSVFRLEETALRATA